LVLPVWSSVCVLTHPSRPWQHDHDPPTRCCGQRLRYCDGDETLPTRADKIELHGCLVICKTQQHLTLALAYKVVHFFSTGPMGLHCNNDVLNATPSTAPKPKLRWCASIVCVCGASVRFDCSARVRIELGCRPRCTALRPARREFTRETPRAHRRVQQQQEPCNKSNGRNDLQ
jgi:hypothetical protein